MFRLILAIFRSNKEPDFRYIKRAPNGIPLRLQNNSLFNIVKYCKIMAKLNVSYKVSGVSRQTPCMIHLIWP